MPPPPSVVLDPAAIPDVTELTSPRHLPDETELALLLSAVELQRQAWQQLQQLRGGAPALLRAMVLRELSGGEAAAARRRRAWRCMRWSLRPEGAKR